jgi:hypothetical protein
MGFNPIPRFELRASAWNSSEWSASQLENDNSGAVGRSALPAAAGIITNVTQFPSIEIRL